MDFNDFSQRELPYNLEAEQTVLGALLIDPDVLSTVLEYIKPESFYNEKHRDLFGVIIRMFSSDRTDVIWLFFGAQAASFIPAVQNAACILKCEHPAYFARSNTRMTDDPFARINRFMKENPKAAKACVTPVGSGVLPGTAGAT